MPRVSVVIPVHNPGPYLGPALASVRNQTLRDFEALCLDDGCTDGSADVLARVARADPRFRILRPGRIGLVAAANLLAREARAPYHARFDADDAMHPRRLELQADFLDRHEDIAAVSCLVRHFPARAVRAGNRAYEAWLNGVLSPEEIARDIFVELPMANPSVMMRAGVFDRVGGYRDNGCPEDYDFWLRAWEAGVRCAKVPRVLHYWREHPHRVTRTHPRYSVEAFLRAKVEVLVRGPLAARRPFVVWGAGMMGRRLTRLLARAGRPPLALLDIDPRKIGRRRRGRPILPPEAVRPGSALVLGAVGARGARALIRARLRGWGLEETRDFWMVA
ncbi:MAG: glycosyltransferase family 2 protein [Planctomycetota bacterium]